MAKARAIVKRRKAVRNIRKITKTMQMIATAKFQKSLKRATGTKPYTQKVRELVAELAATIGNVEHPLLRRPEESGAAKKVALVAITSNRGLAGAYNGSVLRMASAFAREQEAKGNAVELYVAGKKGINYFNFQRRPITQRLEATDVPRFAEIQPLADQFIDQFTSGKIDALYIAYMNFLSAGSQKQEVTQLLPLAAVDAKKGADQPGGADQKKVVYEFSPDPMSLLDELLPLTVRSAMFQAFLDATTSEHVARMVAMKSATDNADKMVKSLTMKYNRARQSQITTELAEIMGGVEAMKK
jgi:F-type H+-transporting ATPase subunit gamma